MLRPAITHSSDYWLVSTVVITAMLFQKWWWGLQEVSHYHCEQSIPVSMLSQDARKLQPKMSIGKVEISMS
jgi:hypothetical protein